MRTLFLVSLVLFSLGQCVEYLLLLQGGHDWSALCRWDCSWYGTIVNEGYDIVPSRHDDGDAANWAFFPVFALVVKAIHAFSPWSLQLTLIIASKLFYFSGVFAFIMFARAWQPGISPWVAGLVVVFNPYSIYGNTGYTESLFLALTCLSFYFLKQNRYVLSGLTGALLAATRLAGGSFGFAYLYRMIFSWRESHNRSDLVLGLALIPAGLAAYMLYLYLQTGDALAFAHIQVAWQREPGNPLSHVLRIFKDLEKNALAGISVVTVICALIYLVREKQHELAIFSLSATLLPLATGLVSLPRYVSWQAPVLFAIASLLNRYRWSLPVYIAITVTFSYLVYTAWFARELWVI
jgi:hypothetical protein